MFKRKNLFILFSMIIVLVLVFGCRDRDQALTLHFVFEDAKGISVGSKVMGDGVFVGQVIKAPESPKPRHVIISVRIDGISPDKKSYMTEDLTAAIKKDSLVTGESYLDLRFPGEPGEPVPDGTVLEGRGGSLDMHEFTVPKDPQQFVETLRMAFVAVHPATDGKTVFYLNWLSIVIAGLVLVVLIIDLLIRLPQGSKRERSSPGIFQKIWLLFCLVLMLRFFMVVVRTLGGMGVISKEILRSLHIGSADLTVLLAQEWPYWVLVILLVTIRFKFDLLMRASR